MLWEGVVKRQVYEEILGSPDSDMNFGSTRFQAKNKLLLRSKTKTQRRKVEESIIYSENIQK